MFYNGNLVEESEFQKIHTENEKHVDNFLNRYANCPKINYKSNTKTINETKNLNKRQIMFDIQPQREETLTINLSKKNADPKTLESINRSKLIKKNSTIQNFYNGLSDKSIVFKINK